VDSAVRVVLVSAPDAEVAGRLARTLVTERLAACVNVVAGVRSVYRWEGKVQDDAEVLLVIKSTDARLAALCARVTALHPYELPEVLALPAVGGSARYLEWVAEESRP
jgi:periplasmic divalent cation tolerance protein